MDGCEAGHEWRPDRESTTYVRYCCATCDAVCAAPEPVDERSLVLSTERRARPEPDTAPRGPEAAPPWASVGSRIYPPAG
ncbi:MAG TPA: hypothetical protein VHH09_03230 [Acidimicrobiales bacterium]|nr:hypothetical protein [Acidimicrobiales bacterium]